MVPPFHFLKFHIMKKYFLTVLFLIVSVCSFAQKSYLQVFFEYRNHSEYGYSYFYGDKPSDVCRDLFTYDKIGEILEKLTGKGYTLDFVTSLSDATQSGAAGTIVYIFSKPSEVTNNVRSVTIDNDEEVTEVARYNLQGLPVKKSDKGVQIIVYSNYTTKIVNIQ